VGDVDTDYCECQSRDLFQELRRNGISDFHNLITKNNVKVALACIHNDPTRYWQIQGVQACSASLKGGIAGTLDE
jgi:hypothetical protein